MPRYVGVEGAFDLSTIIRVVSGKQLRLSPEFYGAPRYIEIRRARRPTVSNVRRDRSLSFSNSSVTLALMRLQVSPLRDWYIWRQLSTVVVGSETGIYEHLYITGPSNGLVTKTQVPRQWHTHTYTHSSDFYNIILNYYTLNVECQILHTLTKYFIIIWKVLPLIIFLTTKNLMKILREPSFIAQPSSY